MKKNIFVQPFQNKAFISNDKCWLEKTYQISCFILIRNVGDSTILRLFVQFFWLLKRAPKAHSYFCWFADYHTLLPALFARFTGRPCYIVLGGYDAAKIPELGYGANITFVRALFVRWSCTLATQLLPVSAFTWRQFEEHVSSKMSGKKTLIYNGAEPFFYRVNDNPKSGIVCSCTCFDERSIRIKGVDFLMKVAGQMPETSFTVIGISGAAFDILQPGLPPNVKLVSFVKKPELREALSSAKVICQFSLFESFCLAMAEGMLCECVPVTIAGLGSAELLDEDCGFSITSQDIPEACQALYKALADDGTFGQRARERILNHFMLEKRFEALGKLPGINPADG